jgi:predicted class III extradiol MEMO1 family dioxygenase
MSNDDDALALFGHSAGSVETTMFGKTRITVNCPHAGCDLSGYVTATKAAAAREIVALIVAEHYRQTEAS